MELAKSLITKDQLNAMGELRIVNTPENPSLFIELLNGLTEAGVDGNT
jgi:hypothetical protein